MPRLAQKDEGGHMIPHLTIHVPSLRDYHRVVGVVSREYLPLQKIYRNESYKDLFFFSACSFQFIDNDP